MNLYSQTAGSLPSQQGLFYVSTMFSRGGDDTIQTVTGWKDSQSAILSFFCFLADEKNLEQKFLSIEM